MNVRAVVGVVLLVALALVIAYGHRVAVRSVPRHDETDRLVRAKWGKALNELPTRTLVIVSSIIRMLDQNTIPSACCQTKPRPATAKNAT